ncbi:hypothetical protein ROA7450_03030 [Roseovarius albus]|uniref:Glutamine amidotransferase domain-containing protein n=1 Tax=Roseovarius albus TaxID=1247867 RepID=A0A1X6ZQR5_9RHOB|nr:hypothetical protein [Roseovarius albus]SLN58755.1 hypothetical protein ROA7450_03030 [Roseovarius albus]
MTTTILFDPLAPWPFITVLFGMVLCSLGLSLWRGLSGWALRTFAALVVLAALTGPVIQQEEREHLDDIVFVVEDRSASQKLGNRDEAVSQAAASLKEQLTARPNTELREITVGDGANNSGTGIMQALSDAMAEAPKGRIAGAILLSDGQVHDLDRASDMPAPIHLLHTGKQGDWDRRLTIDNAPAFAILGEEITMTLRIDDLGAGPDGADKVPLEVSIDGDTPQQFEVSTGTDIELPLILPHGGRNVLQFSTPAVDGELTDRNNSIVVQINGVRDRLSVLLVSGEPHPGGRTWRNLLKSDSSVDLVHFTILRPPEKQDGVPVSELSLIAFPTRELFLEKIDDFDLIIFDRYKRRGILPSLYLDNVRNYVEGGGAVLIAAGPDFASAESIYRTPLADVIPARPTVRIFEEAYRPQVSELGQRHPVTAGLEQEFEGEWGHWLRHIDLEAERGDTLMTGVDDRPLLVLDHVGEGRVALLGSDHAWLWHRGYEGGGPQLELLRRLAHWLMKEPELEEETLWAEAAGQKLRIIRRSLENAVGQVVVTTPSGEMQSLALSETAPGQFEAQFEGPEIGLYRLENGDHTAVIGLGPAAPIEFDETLASTELLEPIIKQSTGGIMALEDGLPRLRDVRAGRPAAGRGWIGLTPRNAYETKSVTQIPLLPAWLMLLLSTLLLTGAWLYEGRR